MAAEISGNIESAMKRFGVARRALCTEQRRGDRSGVVAGAATVRALRINLRGVSARARYKRQTLSQDNDLQEAPVPEEQAPVPIEIEEAL